MQPVTSLIGAEISGVNLADQLEPDLVTDLYTQLLKRRASGKPLAACCWLRVPACRSAPR